MIALGSTALEPLLHVLLVFQQNSQLELTPVMVFTKHLGYGLGGVYVNSSYDEDFLRSNHRFHLSSISSSSGYIIIFLREPPLSHPLPLTLAGGLLLV